jgi:hypothetical protein
MSVDGRRAAFAALGLVLAAAPAGVAAQDRVTTLSAAYDHFYREARNAVGYAQIFRGGGDTPSFEEWQSAKRHTPRGMAGLVSRCEPPVLQARALLVESYTIMERRGPPSDVAIVNQKGAEAARLLDSVADCWQSMVSFERNCLHAGHPSHDRRALAHRVVAGDVYKAHVEQNCTTESYRKPTPYSTGKLIGHVNHGQPRHQKPRGGPIVLNPRPTSKAPPLPNLPPGTLVFDDPLAPTCTLGFSTGTISVTRPQNDNVVYAAGQQQNVITIFVRVCNAHRPNDPIRGTIQTAATGVKTYVYGWGKVMGSPPAGFRFDFLQMRDERGAVGKYPCHWVIVPLRPAT